MKHLRSLYSYKSNVAITIRKGRGGNPRNIVLDADRVPGDFDRRIVMLDNDKSYKEMGKATLEAKRRGIELFKNNPCLEFFLISIIDKRPGGKKSIWYKKEFESKYLGKKKRGELEEYEKLFPKPLLNTKRVEIPALDQLISIIEGKY